MIKAGFIQVPQLLLVVHREQDCPGCLMEMLSVGRSKAYEIAYEVGANTLGKKGDLRLRADKLLTWLQNHELDAAALTTQAPSRQTIKGAGSVH